MKPYICSQLILAVLVIGSHASELLSVTGTTVGFCYLSQCCIGWIYCNEGLVDGCDHQGTYQWEALGRINCSALIYCCLCPVSSMNLCHRFGYQCGEQCRSSRSVPAGIGFVPQPPVQVFESQEAQVNIDYTDF